MWLYISQLISVEQNFQVKKASTAKIQQPLEIYFVGGDNSEKESGLCECATSEELEIWFSSIPDQEKESLLQTEWKKEKE